MAADHDHEIAIKGGSFDLSDLGHLLPGMAEVMPLVGERIWKCYYAAQAHNRKLAAFQLKEAVNLMQKGSILRPRRETFAPAAFSCPAAAAPMPVPPPVIRACRP